MPAGQQVAFKPSLAHVLGEDLHDATVRRQMVVIGQGVGNPGAVRRLEHGREAVRRALVGSEYAEIAMRRAGAQHVAQILPHHRGGLGVALPGLVYRDGVLGHIG